MASEIFSYELKIPKERVAVLIGKKGDIKRHLQKLTKTRLNVDSKEGDVTISGEDALNLFNTKELIKAIGRGFNPEIAQLLLKQDYALEIFNLADFAANRNVLKRIKGRVIGAGGKTREIIENITGVYISVYGKTISIIGEMQALTNARRAVEMLLRGSQHSKVYQWLEKQRKLQRQSEL